jgi:cytochrome c-type biogenesis protein CcmH
MTSFWILAGVMICAAVLFVAIPLMRGPRLLDQASRNELNVSIRRDQIAELQRDLDSGTLSQALYDQGREEIERGLIEDAASNEEDGNATPAAGGTSKGLAFGLALALPALVVSLYFQLGRLDGIDPQVAAPVAQQGEHDIGADELAAMVQKLADRLKAQPEDAEGWMMLGRSYSVMRDFKQAAVAYARAHAIIGDHPDVLANYADALAMANGGEFTEQSIVLIDRAVKADPTHQKSLWLAGTAAFESGNYGRALTVWTALRAQLEPGSDMYQTMSANVAEVRSLSGMTPEAPMAASVQMAQAGAAKVSGRVSVDPSLAAKVDPSATLFIYAKAASGPPMPLAIQRLSASDLPLSFTLDESMSMIPAMSLAKFDQVIVGARISKSGNAIAQSGDLQVVLGPLAVGSDGLDLVIAEVVQ